MDFTRGEIMFYGGFTGIGILVLISIILIIVNKHRKKKLLRKIQEEY